MPLPLLLKIEALIINPYCGFIKGLTNNIQTPHEIRGMAMCYDVKRFERMAKEKKRSKKENEVDFVVTKIEEMQVASHAMKRRKKATSSS
jgi:Fe-S cluster assembly ATPase SufC